MGAGMSIQTFPDALDTLTAELDLPGFLADLARLEWALHQKKMVDPDPARPVAAIAVNPTFTLLALNWQNLAMMVGASDAGTVPLNEPAHVMIWRHPQTRQLHCREAADSDLLVLKLVVEQIDPREAAKLGEITPGDIQAVMDQAIDRGILVSPGSRIRRLTDSGKKTEPALDSFMAADIFTLQWHVTLACDLHCKHCYDRSDRGFVALEETLTILDDFYDFCRQMHVRGQITFTGGNPLLHPHLEKVYRAAAQLGFGIAILGNPTPIEQIRQLVDIARPLYFQISLEGLEAHNDYMRGKGHFARSLAFLQELRALDIYSMVMLTLTRDNLEQVLPLADLLKDQTDSFTFNRLATVGEGASLLMPDRDDFAAFLEEYAQAAAVNPILRTKDNLFNLLRREKGKPLLGGCTGFGCGAAFNFLALLPDGEVHACRKFPSCIGNIRNQRLYDIYQSELAARYRAGSRACRGCDLNPVCRGCLAIAYSLGLDVFEEKDPFCFDTRAPLAE